MAYIASHPKLALLNPAGALDAPVLTVMAE